MNYKIKNFDFEYWDQFVDLINIHWRENHPIIQRSLFEWQYTGFGKMKGTHRSKLLFVENELKGFRGVIPGEYQIDGNDSLFGCSFALWIVTKDVRGKGLGRALMEAAAKEFNILCSLGLNKKTAVPIYKKNNFSYFDALYRYVIPLEAVGYENLCYNNLDLKFIEEWVNKTTSQNIIDPKITISPNDLEDLWMRINHKTKVFGLKRTAEFWNWRYINNKGFKYHFFGDVNKTGVIIARVEKSMKKDMSGKVFRIIEIIPAKIDTWYNKTDPDMQNLILGVLSWARENGCVAADFQISNSKLQNLLEDTGFMKQELDYSPPEASLAGLFQPFSYKPSPINGTYLIIDKKGNQLKLSREETYFVKSDNDMDRTNYWPIVE